MKTDFFSSFHIGNERGNSVLHFAQGNPEVDNEYDVQAEDSVHYGLLQAKYEELISSHALTEEQNSVFQEVIKNLAYGCECPSSLLSKIELSFSSEEGVIVHRRSNQGISFIAIDDEGDSMFSFSSYKSQDKGKRIFFDYGSGSEEAMVYRLLAE